MVNNSYISVNFGLVLIHGRVVSVGGGLIIRYPTWRVLMNGAHIRVLSALLRILHIRIHYIIYIFLVGRKYH